MQTDTGMAVPSADVAAAAASEHARLRRPACIRHVALRQNRAESDADAHDADGSLWQLRIRLASQSPQTQKRQKFCLVLTRSSPSKSGSTFLSLLLFSISEAITFQVRRVVQRVRHPHLCSEGRWFES